MIDAIAAVVATLVDLPRRLEKVEAQQREILDRLGALAGAAAVGPVDFAAAAPVLGKSVATLRRLAKAGQLPGAIRVGRSWRIDLGALRAAGSQERIAELARQARS